MTFYAVGPQNNLGNLLIMFNHPGEFEGHGSRHFRVTDENHFQSVGSCENNP